VHANAVFITGMTRGVAFLRFNQTLSTPQKICGDSKCVNTVVIKLALESGEEIWTNQLVLTSFNNGNRVSMFPGVNTLFVVV
jgi:hypothetical protein